VTILEVVQAENTAQWKNNMWTIRYR